MPTRPIRHGLTLSLYYRDPDGSNGLKFRLTLWRPRIRTSSRSGPPSPPIRSASLSTLALVVGPAQGKPVNDLIFRSDQAESKATPTER
jgi:hypothetical protein